VLLLCVDMRDLAAEQHDLRRVIHSDEKHDGGGCRAASGFEALAADVPGDDQLADIEQGCRDNAAVHASSQSTGPSGNHRKNIVKSNVSTPSEMRKLTACQNSGSPPPIHADTALNAVLTTSETASRKPSPRMPANEIR
jgi:hypothetical protein